MKLHLIVIGKKKSEYDFMLAEYQKRIVSPFSLSVEIIEPLGIDNPTQCRKKESEKLATKLQTGDYIITLDESGKDFTTVSFSHHIEKQIHMGIKRMVFIIGGAYGIDKQMQSRAHLILQLGSFTLPHELARLVLVEQLYRVTNLLGGGKYHHI